MLHFVAGPRLAGGPGLQESSSFVVESRPRSIMECGYGVDPQFSSDASKVVSRGQGLDHATLSQSNVFQVDCSKAGRSRSLVFEVFLFLEVSVRAICYFKGAACGCVVACRASF